MAVLNLFKFLKSDKWFITYVEFCKAQYLQGSWPWTVACVP